MDFGFGPDERLGVLIVGFDEGIDVLSELFDRGEGGAMQRLSFQDGEPDFNLVEPRSPRGCEVEVNVRMTLEPSVVLGLVGAEVVENDMDGSVGVAIGSDDVVHEIEEFDATSTLFVRDGDFAGGHLESGKQGRGAVALVVMAMPGQRPPVRQLQKALRTLQRLDRGLLIDADDNRILGRRHVEPDHVGGLGGKLGIVALAPRLASGKIDPLGAQDAPDLLLMHVAQRRRNQRPRPPREPGRRGTFQDRQNAPAGLDVVLPGRTGPGPLGQTRKSFPSEPASPQAHCPRHRANRARDRPRRAALASHQDDPRAQHIALFTRRCPNSGFKHRTILRRQPDFRSWGYHPNVES